MSEQPLPPAFQGATHRLADGGAPVKVTHWVKDGDHPDVVRYPIDKRDYKGLLVVGDKLKLALRFGDWIIEDGSGGVWTEPYGSLSNKYVALEG